MCGSVREEVERLPHFSPHKLCTAASLGLVQHTFKCEGGVDRFITGVSKGGKNRTRMISVTDEIAPATRSVVAGGRVRGGKGGRESRWASLQQLGRVKCGSKINTAQGSEIPDGTIFAVRPPHSSDD